MYWTCDGYSYRLSEGTSRVYRGEALERGAQCRRLRFNLEIRDDPHTGGQLRGELSSIDA